MNEFSSDPAKGGLPAELVEVDKVLSEIDISERASFEAELRAELASEWRRIRAISPRRGMGGARFAAAAVAALVVIGTLAVPPVRGSLVRLLWSSPEPEPVVEAPLVIPEPVLVLAAEVEESVSHSSKPSPRSEVIQPDLPEWPTILPTTFPVLLDRNAAKQIVADEYPDSLQHAGVGGRVQVLLWVTREGSVDYPQVSNSSGIAEIDMAALRATRTLRFLPATRSGESVGTWVEFSIEFRPYDEVPELESEDHGLQIPLSN